MFFRVKKLRILWLSRKNSAQQFTGSGARCTQNRSECIFFLKDACSPLQTSSDVLATPFQEKCLIAEHYFCGREAIRFCQALRKESANALGQEKKMTPMHFSTPS